MFWKDKQKIAERESKREKDREPELLRPDPPRTATKIEGKPVSFNGPKTDRRLLKRVERVRQYLAVHGHELSGDQIEDYKMELKQLEYTIKRKRI